MATANKAKATVVNFILTVKVKVTIKGFWAESLGGYK